VTELGVHFYGSMHILPKLGEIITRAQKHDADTYSVPAQSAGTTANHK